MRKLIVIAFVLAASLLCIAGTRPPPIEEGILLVNQHQIQYSGAPMAGWRVASFDLYPPYDVTAKTLEAALQPAIDLAMQTP